MVVLEVLVEVPKMLLVVPIVLVEVSKMLQVVPKVPVLVFLSVKFECVALDFQNLPHCETQMLVQWCPVSLLSLRCGWGMGIPQMTLVAVVRRWVGAWGA